MQKTHTFVLPRVQTLGILGGGFEEEWRDHYDVDQSLEKAQKYFQSEIAFYRTTGIALKDRFDRYRSRVQSVLLFACEGKTADVTTIGKIHSFEGRCLAIMSGIRKKRNQDWTQYQKTRLEIGRKNFQKLRFKRAIQIWLEKQWHWAKDVSEAACIRVKEMAAGILPQLMWSRLQTCTLAEHRRIDAKQKRG